MSKNKLWMRKIRITLSSQLAELSHSGKVPAIIFGDDSELGKVNPNQLTIKVQGTKYTSTLKDKGTVTITNINYDTITKIVLYKYYNIKIEVGYRDNNFMTYFDGEVSYISQKIHSRHDCECYITFANKLVAKFSQNRLNFGLRSGINLYSALNYICLTNRIPTDGLSQKLRQQVIQETINQRDTAASIIDSAISQAGGNFDIGTGNEHGNVINISTIKDKRQIRIDPNSIPIGGGNPTVSSDGLNITLLPTFNFRVGDIIVVDNSIIDVSINSAEAVTSTFNTNYMDTNGMYMIYQIDYTFENRGGKFDLSIKARALDVIQGITGGAI